MLNKCIKVGFALSWAAASLMANEALAAPTQNLLDIYRQAQTNDPNWAAAQSSRLAAQEKVVQGKALLLPTAKLSANASHNQTDIISERGNLSAFSYSGADKFETYGYRVDVSHPLYRKQNSVQFEQSQTQVSQAEAQLNNSRQDLMLRVSQAYFDVLLAQDKIDLIVAQKAAISRQLEQAKANFDVGTSTVTDVHEAQARFDLTTAQEIAAINDLEVKKRAIQAITTQLPPRLASAKSNMQTVLPGPSDMESWVELAEQNNLTLKVQQQVLQLATQEIERTHAGHLPTLDVVASYNDARANGGVAEDLRGFNRTTKTGVIGLQFEIPLYQGGAITSREREAAANRQKAQDDFEAARRQADLQARQAFLNVSSTVAQVKAYEQALTSSQSQLDSTNLGYEVGVRTSVDVLNAQQQLYSAKRDLLQARYTYLLSVIQLKAAAGVLQEKDLEEISQNLEGA